MTTRQMKRIIGVNVLAFINIISLSMQMFFKIQSLLTEHEDLLKNNKELIKDFKFSLYSINIHTTAGDITLANLPLLISFFTLAYNIIEIIIAIARNRIKNKNA